MCQQVKINKHKHVKPSYFQSESTQYRTIQIDLVRPLPVSNSHWQKLTILNQATFHPVALPPPSSEPTEVWQAFKCNWVAVFSVPTLTISDQGSQFTSPYWRKQCQIFAIRSKTTPVYHPESKGMVECWHRTLKTAITSV